MLSEQPTEPEPEPEPEPEEVAGELVVVLPASVVALGLGLWGKESARAAETERESRSTGCCTS